MKRTIATAGIVAAIAVAGYTGIGVANAATENNATTNPMSSLVSAVAKKFNLKETDVQAVFDDQRTVMEADREANAKEKVSQLVKDGKLTQAQADLINTKRAELQKTREANRTNMDSKTKSERRTTMNAERTKLDQRFTDNDIPTEYRNLVLGGKGHGGHGMRGERMGDKSSSSAVPDQTDSDQS